MSAEGLNPDFLAAVRAHRPTKRVRAQAGAAGLDLDSLRETDPLTYAAVNAVPLVRTDARLSAQVGAALAQIGVKFQLFSVPLNLPQTDLELRVFPDLLPGELERFDNSLGTLAATEPGVFFRTVNDRSGERRELAWPLEPARFRDTPALVGPFSDEDAANSWGHLHADPRMGLVYDALPYAGGWYCDVFRGE